MWEERVEIMTRASRDLVEKSFFSTNNELYFFSVVCRRSAALEIDLILLALPLLLNVVVANVF